MYHDNYRQQSFGWTGVITFVVFLAVIGGVGYYTLANSAVDIDDSLLSGASSQLALVQTSSDGLVDKFTGAPEVELEAVGGGEAKGRALMYVEDGVTYHKLILDNLPPLPANSFYEGWLFKDEATGEVVSTGKVNVDSEKNTGSLFYQSNGDQTTYRQVVVTIEQDENTVVPAKHILEGVFPAGSDFTKNQGQKNKSIAGIFEDYSKDKLATLSSTKTLLFFSAPWCPTCRALENDLITNSDLIPADVAILKTDYDKETTLKNKYQVSAPNTLIWIDEQGKKLKEWTNTSDLKSLIEQII